jgi:RecB family exonuclease
MRSSFFLSSLMGLVLSSFMGFHTTLIFLHQAKQRWHDEEFLLSLKLDGLKPFKLDGIADDSDLLSSSQAEMA